MGQTHSFSAQSIPFFYNCKFRAVLHTLCGRDPLKTENQARRWGFLHATSDFDSVAGNPEIDIIDICTPNPLHYPQAKAAILAGKHVYCDKPLCVTAAQADELAELAKKHNVCCQVTFQHRFLTRAVSAALQISAQHFCTRLLPTGTDRMHGATRP